MHRAKLQKYRELLSDRLVLASTVATEWSSGGRFVAGPRDRLVLEEIAAAIGRIESGCFGRCQACGTAVAEERLARRPAAALCGACAQPPRGSNS